MPAKQKTTAKRSTMDSIQKEQRKERKMMADMNAKERLMKWLLIAVIILLLLLILFAGYATDWLRGVHKDDSVTPVNSSLDSAKGTDGSVTTNGSTGTGATARTNTTNGTNSSNTSRASESNNTSHDTATTTNNNTTTPAPNPGLLSLYTDSSVGDDVSTILNNAQLLGLSKTCHSELLIQVCDITDGTLTVTTKNLLGTGIVTSLTKNF